MNKRRVIAVLILAAATGITAVLAVKTGINPPVGNIIGSFCAIAALVVFSRTDFCLLRIACGLGA